MIMNTPDVQDRIRSVTSTVMECRGDGYWYLATVYSKHPDGLSDAFGMAAEQAALLVASGINVFCPITHSHPIAMARPDLFSATDHDVWMKLDAPFIHGAKGLIVVTSENWRDSVGIAAEIEAFKALGKQVFFMEPDKIPSYFLN